jgi:hypothetical protein
MTTLRTTDNKLKGISKNFEDMQSNLSENLPSEAISTFLKEQKDIRKELSDIKREIDPLDAFVKISEESVKRPHANWLDVLFGDEITNRTIIPLRKQVSELNAKYNSLELERSDLFDITVAVYSTTLQRESLNETIERMESQIGYAFLALIAVIIGLLLSAYYSHKQIQSTKEENKKQIEKLEALNSKLSEIVDQLKTS